MERAFLLDFGAVYLVNLNKIWYTYPGNHNQGGQIMKKGLILVLAAALVLGFAFPSYAVKAAAKAMNTIEDNPAAAPRVGAFKFSPSANKAVPTSLVDTIQNIRTILSAAARNMVCSPGATAANDTVQIVYLRGNGATYALWHAYSLDGGATWSKQMVDNTSRPRYPTAVVGDNDEGSGIFRPIHMAYHRQIEMQMYYAREDGSLGDGLYTSVQISNSSDADLWIPTLNRGKTCLNIGAMDNGVLGTSWGFFSNDMGKTWRSPRMVEYPIFQDWAATPIMLYHTHQESLIAFMPLPFASFDLSGDANQPVYWMSTDSGVTFDGPYPVVPETLLPQFSGSCWWYNYDAIMVNGVPHLAFDLTDYEGALAGPNGSCVFHATPKVHGDYSQGWKVTKVSDVEDPNTGIGQYPGNPSIGADASGNLFITYCDWSHSTFATGLRVTASTDGGEHWTVPYVVVPQDTLAYDIYPQEMSREIGTAVHIIACDAIQTPDAGGLGPLYHYSVPVTEIMATGIAPLVNTPTIYTVGKPMGTGDTTMTPAGDSLYFSWSTGFGYGGEYRIQFSMDSTFASLIYNLYLNDNEFTSIGMWDTCKWFWRVKATLETSSGWSNIFSFIYKGETIIGPPPGVAGDPSIKPAYSFALNQSRPNPVKGSAEIAFNLPKAGNYSVTIYNIVGQPVRVLEGKGNAGVNKISWNSCDNHGQKVSNGVYIYTLKALGNTATQKLVVIR